MKSWHEKLNVGSTGLNSIMSYLHSPRLRNVISTWLTNGHEQAEQLIDKWLPEQPKINPPCIGTILCEHTGRHKRQCLGGMVSVDTFWRKMKKA